MTDLQPNYLNCSRWFKSSICLDHLKKGLVPFIETVYRFEHAEILKKIQHNQSCDQCHIKELKPDHCKKNTNGRDECPLGQKGCNCLKGKKYKTCKNNVCGIIHDEIIRRHVYRSPNWTNSNIQYWCSDYFEILKCFFKARGNDDKKSVHELDVAPLLQLVINNTGVNGRLKSENEIKRVIDKRNELVHSNSHEVEEEYYSEFQDDCITILENEALKGIPESKTAVENIKNLNDYEVLMVPKEMTELLSKKHLSDIESQNEDPSLTTKDLKEELTSNLISFYTQECATTPLSQTGHDMQVESIYIPPKTSEIKIVSNKVYTIESKTTNYDIFQNGKTTVLTAEKGCGKTVLLYKNILRWCKAHNRSGYNCKSDTDEEIEKVRKIRYLFYIDLRKIKTEETDIVSMIKTGIISGLGRSSQFMKGTFIEDILTDEKCLIFLDGLDVRKDTNAIIQLRAWEQTTVFITSQINVDNLISTKVEKRLQMTADLDETTANKLILAVLKSENMKDIINIPEENIPQINQICRKSGEATSIRLQEVMEGISKWLQEEQDKQ